MKDRREVQDHKCQEVKSESMILRLFRLKSTMPKAKEIIYGKRLGGAGARRCRERKGLRTVGSPMVKTARGYVSI